MKALLKLLGDQQNVLAEWLHDYSKAVQPLHAGKDWYLVVRLVRML